MSHKCPHDDYQPIEQCAHPDCIPPDPKDAPDLLDEINAEMAKVPVLEAERDQLRARVAELETHAAHLRAENETWRARDKQGGLNYAALSAVNREMEQERDAARAQAESDRAKYSDQLKIVGELKAECERLGALANHLSSNESRWVSRSEHEAVMRANLRLEAEAAVMRVAFRAIIKQVADVQTPGNRIAIAVNNIAVGALVETTAGQAALGVIEAARDTLKDIDLMRENKLRFHLVRTVALVEALDAWTQATGGGKGDGNA